MEDKKKLINSDEFEKALEEGAECKKDMLTSYKTQNKSNYQAFYEQLLTANDEIQHILDIKKKNRTDVDNQKLVDFKQTVRAMYSQVQSLCVKEDIEDGKKTKLEKIVDKIVPVIQILRYIGKNDLDEAFARKGVKIQISKLEDDNPALANDNKRKVITDTLTAGIAIRQKVLDDDQYISTDIFQTKVPTDLQYDKSTNNTGLKTGDWRKLVDMKAKLIMANSEEAKEKVDDKIEHIASEKQFEIARAELVRDKLVKL